LTALGALPSGEMAEYIALGELGLDGAIAPVAGVLPAAIHASAMGRGIICPAAQGGEAAWAGEIRVLAAPTLIALINHFRGQQILPTPVPRVAEMRGRGLDLKDIKGQETAKRALEVAAAGGHNLLMIGPPGSGKSMLAARLPGILPPLEPAEALEVSMIHSIAGGLPDGKLLRERPFREPHHSASLPALVGGGMRAKPGEISLAHKGVLFLDELPEFQRATLEALRQPVETGRIAIARANAHVSYPARFQMVAAMNPCRCGHLDDPALACNRAPRCALDYQAKISGRCSTASTCMSKSRRSRHRPSPPPIYPYRRRGKARPMSPLVCRRRARSNSGATRRYPRIAASPPMPRPTARFWKRWRRPTPTAAGSSPRRPSA
jgi:magnesium chelatase family protein